MIWCVCVCDPLSYNDLVYVCVCMCDPLSYNDLFLFLKVEYGSAVLVIRNPFDALVAEWNREKSRKTPLEIGNNTNASSHISYVGREFFGELTITCTTCTSLPPSLPPSLPLSLWLPFTRSIVSRS